MVYREIIAVCSQIRTKHTNTLCGQNVELLNVKLAVHKVHWALEGFTEIQIERVFVARISLPQREDGSDRLSSPGEPINLSKVYVGWCQTLQGTVYSHCACSYRHADDSPPVSHFAS